MIKIALFILGAAIPYTTSHADTPPSQHSPAAPAPSQEYILRRKDVISFIKTARDLAATSDLLSFKKLLGNPASQKGECEGTVYLDYRPAETSFRGEPIFIVQTVINWKPSPSVASDEALLRAVVPSGIESLIGAALRRVRAYANIHPALLLRGLPVREIKVSISHIEGMALDADNGKASMIVGFRFRGSRRLVYLPAVFAGAGWEKKHRKTAMKGIDLERTQPLDEETRSWDTTKDGWNQVFRLDATTFHDN